MSMTSRRAKLQRQRKFTVLQEGSVSVSQRSRSFTVLTNCVQPCTIPPAHLRGKNTCLFGISPVRNPRYAWIKTGGWLSTQPISYLERGGKMNEHVWVNVSGQPASGLSNSDELRVMYSGIDRGTLVMGDAVLTGGGLGRLDLTGTQPVRVGMALTLLIFLPEAEEAAGIAEARVLEVLAGHFVVDLLSLVKVATCDLEQYVQQALERQKVAR